MEYRARCDELFIAYTDHRVVKPPVHCGIHISVQPSVASPCHPSLILPSPDPTRLSHCSQHDSHAPPITFTLSHHTPHKLTRPPPQRKSPLPHEKASVSTPAKPPAPHPRPLAAPKEPPRTRPDKLREPHRRRPATYRAKHPSWLEKPRARPRRWLGRPRAVWRR